MNKKNVKKDPILAIDMMHYKANRLSFWLIILTIALNIAMFLIIYKTTECTPNIQLGIDLLINVVVMLVCFLAAEKNKRYSKNWSIASIVIGVIQIARIFFIPLLYYIQFKQTGKGLHNTEFIWCVSLLILSGVCMIVAGVITYRKCITLAAHEPLLNKEEAKKDVRT